MDGIKRVVFFVYIIFTWISGSSLGIDVPKTLDELKQQELELRRNLLRVTQDLISEKTQDFNFFHSYIFKSGAGNREELEVKILKGDRLFEAGRGVSSWELIDGSSGRIYLMGFFRNALSLVVSNKLVLTNRSADFSEHSLDIGADVSCLSLFCHWNASAQREEVMAAVAMENPPDIVWLKITDGQMEEVYRLPHHRKSAALSVVTYGSSTRLVLVDFEPPIMVHYFDILFNTGGGDLEIRLIQSFPLDGPCRGMSVSVTPSHVYLAFSLEAPRSVAVYRATGDHFVSLARLAMPGVTGVQSFRLANHVYLAIDGKEAAVIKLADSGDLVSELALGSVSEWLVAPVATYRKDIVLFARTADGLVKMFVWGGTTHGFVEAALPQCEACLDHEWRGAVALPFHSQTLLLLPRANGYSSLVTVSAALGEMQNPILLKVRTTVEAMEKSEKILEEVRWKIAQAEESLKYVVKRNGENIITANWDVQQLKANQLDLSEGALPSELNRLAEKVSEATDGFEALERETERRRDELWGMRGFTGKLTVKGQMTVDNLTTNQINGATADQIFNQTFRRNRPELIEGEIVVESLKADSVDVERLNGNVTADHLKYTDAPVVFGGNLTALSPVTVAGNVDLMADGTINGKPCPKCISKEQRKQAQVMAGRNLTVLRVNGLDWAAMNKSVVYKNKYQMVPGDMFIKGNMKSDEAMWVGLVEDKYTPVERKPNKSLPILEVPQDQGNRKPYGANWQRGNLKSIDPYSDIVFTDLEVAGDLICSESEWGESAVGVLRSDANPVRVNSLKTFPAGVRATTLDLPGFSFGVADGSQTTDGPVESEDGVTPINSLLPGAQDDFSPNRQMYAHAVLVTESLNGIPLTDFIYKDGKTVVVEELKANNADVTQDIVVNGKICGHNLTDWNKRRLSIKEDQNISGHFEVSKVQTADISGLEEPDSVRTDEIYLEYLHVVGDITTEQGLNGHNLSAIGASAVWLFGNSDITGHLVFKDEVRFQVLECQGFFNDKLCVGDPSNIDYIYRDSEGIAMLDKKTFLNPLKVVENVHVSEINGHNFEDILSKTTEQKINGDLYVTGDVSSEETTLFGLLNSQNMSEFLHRCSLANETITCSSDVVLESNVEVEHFNSSALINGVDFDGFTSTLVNLSDPQQITGLKDFSRQSTVDQAMVAQVNGRDWSEFLLSAASQLWPADVVGDVTFSRPLTVNQLYVEKDLDAESINNVSFPEWQESVVYLNESFDMKRPLHLVSAASEGNISLMNYGPVSMRLDLIRRKGDSTVTKLSVGSLKVTEKADLDTAVNGKPLSKLYENTFKVSGDQTFKSGLTILGQTSVVGSAFSEALVNGQNLQDAVTLYTNQTLDGMYEFECIAVEGNVYSSGLMSGVNITLWGNEAVLKKTDQHVKGHWVVNGELNVKGPVKGTGRLANVSLIQLTENITANIVNVHRQMKNNLSAECQMTNELLQESRDQNSHLVRLDQTQTLRLDTDISVITHFETGDDHYLTLSENQCYTNFYVWNGKNGNFTYLYRDKLGLKVQQIIVLQRNNLTYLVTVSSDLPSDCHFSGVNLWLFTEHHPKHIERFDFQSHKELHGLNNNLYSLNSTNVIEWDLYVDETSAYFYTTMIWTVKTHGKKFVREGANLGLVLQDPVGGAIKILNSTFPLLESLNGLCSEVLEYSVDSKRQLLAMAITEEAEVPRYADIVKIYHRDGHLFDKLQAHRPTQLRWLPVPDQTWLMFVDNLTSLQLYHFQGGAKGFLLKLSTFIKDSEVIALALPLHGYINPQPYILLRSRDTVTVLRAVLQGDPYLGPDTTCIFDDDLLSVPNL